MSEELVRQPGESLQDFLKRRREAVAGTPAPTPAPAWDADLIPALDPNERAASPERVAIDAVVGQVDIVDAYRRWSKKMEPKVGQRRESIMVSCPNPKHPDKNPSAWMTLDKGDGGVGTCAVCGGFDKYDIAAWAFGYDVPSYRATHFKEVVVRMAEDLGYRVMIQGKDEWAEKIPEASAPTPTAPTAKEAESSTASTTSGKPVSTPATASDDEDDDEPSAVVGSIMPPSKLDWQKLPIPDDSFLSMWMETTTRSYEPDEFYLWLGLAGLGLAIGNDVVLKDMSDVRGNLLLCLVGGTGTGKSISLKSLEQLNDRAFRWREDTGSGVKFISSPGSGEALIDTFNHRVDDPTGSGTKITVPVRGFYREAELSTFIKKAMRSGSTVKEIVMEMYDSAGRVGVTSRSAGTAEARDHFMTLVSTTQPEALGGLMTVGDAVSGFLNRWVFVYGTSKKRPALSTYTPDVDSLVDPIKNIHAWGSRKRMLRFDTDAHKAFEMFYDATIRPLVECAEPSPFSARLGLLAKKVTMLFAVNSKRDYINTTDVECFRLMWPSIVEASGIVSVTVSKTEIADCQDRIVAYMRSHPESEYSVRELANQSGARKYRNDMGMILKAVMFLSEAGFIEEAPRPKAGRPTKKYRYAGEGARERGGTVIPLRSS